MFRALLCPSSGARDYNVDYRIGHFVLGSSFSLQSGHHSNLTAPNLQPTAKQERNDQCGIQHYSRERLMMGIVVPETCWAYKQYNKIVRGIQLVFILQVSQWCTVQQTPKVLLDPILSQMNPFLRLTPGVCKMNYLSIISIPIFFWSSPFHSY